MLKNLIFTTMLAGTILFHGCAKRDDHFKDPAKIVFSEQKIFPFPDCSKNSEKIGFGDYTGDGIEDVIEIRDEAWIGQRYTAKISPGYNKDGVLHFSTTKSYTIEIPLKLSWFSAQTKIDAADVNGDGFCDIIFSEYSSGMFKDTYHAKVALNQGDGRTFKFAEESRTEKRTDALEQLVVVALEAFADSYGTSGDMNDYLQMDWADANGDKRDDFMILWKDGYNLYVSAIISDYVGNSKDKIAFSTYPSQAMLPNFMMNRNASNIDVEDFNGDNIADIILYYSVPLKDEVVLSVASGNQDYDQIFYTPQKDVSIPDVDLNFLNFEKYDSFDGNFDNKADYVHIGITDGKPVIAYAFAKSADSLYSVRK